jgi:hypothetical protein
MCIAFGFDDNVCQSTFNKFCSSMCIALGLADKRYQFIFSKCFVVNNSPSIYFVVGGLLVGGLFNVGGWLFFQFFCSSLN